MKKILFILLILLLPEPAFTWQHVTVDEQFQTRLSLDEIRDRALESGFRKAVSQEVDEITPGRITQDRKSALMKHINDRISALVQGYRRTSWQKQDDALILEMEVDIDTGSLRTLLRKTGVYYTSDSAWPYELNTRGVSPEDFFLLQELQLVTGTVVEGDAATVLNLGKSAQGVWSGSIVHEQINLSISGANLQEVWFNLWGIFFAKPEIKSVFVKSLVLDTEGWATTDSIMNFDRILETWNREVEHKNIISVHFNELSLGASWEIRSLIPESLKDRLEGYLRARGIHFSTRQ